MLKPDLDKWDLTLDSLYHDAIHAPHPRTRERFLALYLIASQNSNATKASLSVHRDPQTVMAWVKLFNQQGPDALTYHKTGGRPPLFVPSEPSD